MVICELLLVKIFANVDPIKTVVIPVGRFVPVIVIVSPPENSISYVTNNFIKDF